MARLRFMEGLPWQAIEKRVGVSRRTLQEWRKKDGPWQEAAEEVVAEMKAQALPTSWGALLRNAHLGDTAAAKELLNRCEGAVPEEHRHGLTEEAIALMRQRERKPDGSGP